MLDCILALYHWWQYLIGKQFNILTDHAPNQYILSQYELFYRQVLWVELLADYAANFVYKPGNTIYKPDTLSRIPALHVIENNQAFLEAVHLAQESSADQEFFNFKHLATQHKSDFQVIQRLIVRKLSGSIPLAIIGDALG